MDFGNILLIVQNNLCMEKIFFYINENDVILYENQLFFPFEDLLVKNLTQEQVQQVKEGNTVIINTLRNRRIKEEKTIL